MGRRSTFRRTSSALVRKWPSRKRCTRMPWCSKRVTWRRARAACPGSNKSANTSRPRLWRCRSARTCKRLRSTNSSLSSCIRSSLPRHGRAGQNSGLGGRFHWLPEGRNTMWKGFQKPKRLASELESLTEKYGRFSAQPFERGWGTTVGNALRRALLSSIEGAAITAMKIEGVLHEFSSIPGVVEDATDIILNLKQVPIKLNTDLPKTIYVNVEQAGPVTSAQIEEDADFAVLDKSVYIATVSEGGKLQIEMRAKNGRGYVAADRNYDEDLPIGYIPVDSVHSPVRKVNYSVEAARLGQMTDYEKLMMEVWTNGAITPQDSIGLATKLVKDHMSIFINFEEPVDTVEVPQDVAHDPRLEHLDRSVEELELSVRSYNCLKNANIQTIRELVQKSENEMLKTKNFGRKPLNEIKAILVKMGLSLGMKFDEHGRIIWPPLPSQTAAPSPEDTVGGGL